MGLPAEEARVFLEVDGTEIDDDDCFKTLEDGTVFVVCSEWQSQPATTSSVDASEKGIETPDVVAEMDFVSSGSDENLSSPQEGKLKTY